MLELRARKAGLLLGSRDEMILSLPAGDWLVGLRSAWSESLPVVSRFHATREVYYRGAESRAQVRARFLPIRTRPW